MTKIVVFDSGLGSLSIIDAIQKVAKSDLVYLADQQSYPYGAKSQVQLAKIIQMSISLLEKRFLPDLIVVASNTPSLMLNLTGGKIIDVKPSLKDASKASKTRQIAILGTKGAVNSKGIDRYIKECNLGKNFKVFKINGSELVDLVESGKFYINKKYCIQIIKKILDQKLSQNNIDTVTLSSTHLPFLKPLLEKQYPKVSFLDPASIVAQKILLRIKNNQTRRNSLNIYATGDTKIFQSKLKKIGIKNKVKPLSF